LKRLTDELYDYTNKTIGKVGNGTKERYSVTGEEYVAFAMRFTNVSIVVPVWEKWINAYREFTLNRFTGTLKDLGKPLIVYWRVKPEITEFKTGKEILSDEFPNIDGGYVLYARLLISAQV
jgi:hypothetical protein